MRYLKLIATTLATVPATVFALTATDAMQAAYKTYKKNGVVSNELIVERVANLAKLKEDCNISLNQLAFDSLRKR